MRTPPTKRSPRRRSQCPTWSKRSSPETTTIQKLVEIALRTISPGINDPNTAINCIYIINTLLGKLSEIYGNYTIVTSKDKNIKITFEDFNFESDLYHIFYQIIHYGKEDLSVVIGRQIGRASCRERV